VTCPPDAAASVVDELRAVFAFLEREALFPRHPRVRASSGRTPRRRFEKLSDPRSFGAVKTVMMAGHEAGFDLSTEEGLAAWLGPRARRSPTSRARREPPPAARAEALEGRAERPTPNERRAERTSRKKTR